MKRRKLDEIDLFKLWLVERGAELLVQTNEYELVRFRGDGVVSVIYTNKKGQWTTVGRAQASLDAFRDRSPGFRFGKNLPLVGTTPSKHQRDVLLRTLIERDGDVCFYCAAPFSDGMVRMKEHLVARTHYGPDHISNLFLSCVPCNIEAGHLSAPEKIRLRDRKRRGVGSALLARVLAWMTNHDGVVGSHNDPTVFAEITNFLHQKPKETTDAAS